MSKSAFRSGIWRAYHINQPVYMTNENSSSQQTMKLKWIVAIVNWRQLHNVCPHEVCDMRSLIHIAHCNGLKYRHSVNHSILTSAIRKTLISYFGIPSKRSNPITDILPAALCDSTNNDSSTIQIKGWDRNKSRKLNPGTQVNFSIAKKMPPMLQYVK